MKVFVKKIIAIFTVMAALLQWSAAFAVPADFMPEDILGKRARSRFNSSIEENDGFDPYAYSLDGFVIGIDPGHQLEADERQENVYPNSDIATKDRMTPGEFGVCSGIAEYDINLSVSGKLADLLKQAGAEVVLTRSKNDVSISNAERACMMNDAGVDFWIRVHCNSSKSQRTNGAAVIAPDSDMAIHDSSEELAQYVLTQFCAATGADCRGVSYTSAQTGFNWSNSPVVTIEMGYLSNPEEDVLLGRSSYQDSCANGIFCGIAAYCAERDAA